jgi:flagellar protein FliS
MAAIPANYSAYKRVDVETASQGKLIVMLYNGAIQRAEEARRQLERGRMDLVHNNLLRAQDIVLELRSALNMSAGEIAVNLDRSYEYFLHLLVKANLRKDPEPIKECVALMSDLRDAWQELFERVRQDTPISVAPPPANPHGAAVLNLQG